MEIPWAVCECVYVFRQGRENLFKVGRTGAGVEARIRQLATGNPKELSEYARIEVLLGDGPRVEAYLLNVLGPKRARDGGGRDFFEVTPEELQPHIDNARGLAQRNAIRVEVTRLAKLQSNGRILEPTADDLAKRKKVDEILAQKAILNAELDVIIDGWKMSIATADGIEGVAT